MLSDKQNLYKETQPNCFDRFNFITLWSCSALKIHPELLKTTFMHQRLKCLQWPIRSETCSKTHAFLFTVTLPYFTPSLCIFPAFSSRVQLFGFVCGRLGVQACWVRGLIVEPYGAIQVGYGRHMLASTRGWLLASTSYLFLDMFEMGRLLVHCAAFHLIHAYLCNPSL